MLKAMGYYIYKNINNNNMGILQESLGDQDRYILSECESKS